MNLNEFQGDIDNSNIVDPNLARKQQGTQDISIKDPNLSNLSRKKIVTPQEMGFTHEEPKILQRPEDPILDSMEKAIARKQREARLLADAIDESDGEGVSEEEFQDLLVQARDEIYDDGIPTETLREDVMPPKSTITMIPDENPTQDIMDELDRELEEDEADYAAEVAEEEYEEEDEAPTMYRPEVEEVKEEPKIVKPVKESTHETSDDNIFKNFESGDINFDEENEDLEDNVDEAKLAEKEQEEQLKKLRTLVRQKISPVAKGFDISTYTTGGRRRADLLSGAGGGHGPRYQHGLWPR